VAGSHLYDYLLGATKSSQESLEKAIEVAQKIIAMDDGYPSGHGLLSCLYPYKREYDKAITEGERAITLNPSGANMHAWYGISLILACRPEEAITSLKKAIRLNPFGPSWYFANLGGAYRLGGRFEEAVSAYKKALQRAPNSLLAHLGLASAYSLMGREEDARAEVAEVLRINPKFSLDHFAKTGLLYKDQSVNDKIVNALRKAGLK